MDTLNNFENVANNNYINLNESFIIPNDFNDIHFKLLRIVDDGDEMQMFTTEESSINYRLLHEFCSEKSFLTKIKLMHKLSTEVSHGLENSGLKKRNREGNMINNSNNSNNNNINNNIFNVSPDKIDNNNNIKMNMTPNGQLLQQEQQHQPPCALLLTSKLEKLNNRKRLKILEDAATKYRRLRDSLIRRIKEIRQNLANVDCTNINNTNNNSSINKHSSTIYNDPYNMEYITRCAYKDSLLTKLVMSMDNLFCCNPTPPCI